MYLLFHLECYTAQHPTVLIDICMKCAIWIFEFRTKGRVSTNAHTSMTTRATFRCMAIFWQNIWVSLLEKKESKFVHAAAQWLRATDLYSSKPTLSQHLRCVNRTLNSVVVWQIPSLLHLVCFPSQCNANVLWWIVCYFFKNKLVNFKSICNASSVGAGTWKMKIIRVAIASFNHVCSYHGSSIIAHFKVITNLVFVAVVLTWFKRQTILRCFFLFQTHVFYRSLSR